ncbi:sushi, von Willebrand factor type A, EGF and pentraxin domain-containing protein 1-like [Mya arenaria]|uniref:sushi, von Willebrand factor type A, EGF and pentraxin domain-containing protein 1-like n=1 Tax=Mya arenaria TaxID=6604 RepID=UPI0022E02C31|nr:sushi, von Willebrand factor type A, EGF and pentraxin domain-containing protein 1-like [Mya arenaria]XP_052782388.1 sushi, von Willebrand factor type A, EGF and pentraxin domain-containing protein 1-like [Mya arenaria]
MAYSFAQSVKENNRHTDDRIPQDADGYVDLSDNNDIGFAWIDNVERQINWDKTVRDVNDDNFMTARGDMLRTTLHQDTKESPQHNGDLGETYKKDFLRGTGRDVNIMLGVKQKENDHRPTRDYKLGASGRCPDLEFSRRVDFLGKSKKRNELDRSRVAQSFDTGRIDNAIQSSRRDNNLRMTSVQDTHLENTQDYDNLGQTYKNNVFQGTECDRDKITSREDPDSSTDYETTTRWGQSKYYKRSRKNPASPTYDRTAFRKSKHGDAGRKLSTLAEVNKKDGLQAAKTYDYAYSGVISKSQANNNAHTPGWNMMADSPFMGNMNNQFNQVIPRLAPSSTMSDYSSEKWDEQSTTDSSSTGSISLEEQAAKRSRLIIVCLILIAILSLIAIVVPAVILVSRPDDITEKYALETRVISESFTDELQNNQSEEYRNFTSLFCKELERTANESNQQQHFIKSFEGCTVSRLRRGSVVVSFIIVITRSKGSNRLSTDTLKSLLGISSSEDVQLGSFIIGTELVVLDVKILENDEPAIPNRIAYNKACTLHDTCANPLAMCRTGTCLCPLHRFYDIENEECVPVNCGNLPSIENGNMTSNGSMYGSILSILCYEGHQFHDGGNRTNIGCVAHGSWGELPPCIPKKCSFIQLNEHVILENGTIEASYSYGTTLGVHCENGYTLQGEVTITCQSDTIWTNDTVCIPINCTGFDIPRNTYIEKGMNSKHIYKDNVTFVCKEGFTMIGDAIITCQANKSWTSLPSCAPVNCTNVVLPSHSGIITDNHSEMLVYNDSLTLFCDNGYDLNGSSEVWCLHDGNWTQFPSCDPVRCEKLLWPVNSVINMNLTNLLVYNESISIECINGYQLNGSDTVTCLSDGNLTDVPNCDPVVCKQFTVPDFSKRMGMAVNDIATEYYVNDTVIFECLTNYVMFGNANVTCLFDGNWSPLPKCVNCQNFTVDDGTVIIEQPEAVVMCSTGFVLDGNDTVICNEDGNWTTLPVCKRKPCPDFILPQKAYANEQNTNNNVFGDILNISCSTGYKANGNEYLTVACSSSGKWNDSVVCNPVVCTNNHVLNSGYILSDLLNEYDFNTSVTVACADNYTMFGEGIVTCLADGNWSSIPKCVQCSEFEIENGTVNISQPVAKVMCDTGFILDDNDTVICKEDGNWTALPVCKRIPCPNFNLTQMAYADRNITNNVFGDILTISCGIGYKANGQEYVKVACNSSGKWNDSVDCDPVICRGNDTPANAYILNGSSNELSFNTSVSIACEENYTMFGEDIVACLADGNLSSIPKCVQCPEFEIENGTVNISQPVAKVMCDTGFILDDNDTVICKEDGNWTALPVCKRIPCPNFNLTQMAYADRNITNNVFGDILTISCGIGYKANGQEYVKVACNSSGKWNDSVDCDPVICRGNYTAANAIILNGSSNELSFNTSVSIACEENYTMFGEGTVTCLADGYLSSIPKCVQCSEFEIENGTVNISQPVAKLMCDTGFVLDDNDTVICKEDGNWTALPVCKRIPCPNFNLTQMAYADRNITNNVFGDILTISCGIGYKANGQEYVNVACNSSGKWNDSVDCDPVICRGNYTAANAIILNGSSNELSFNTSVSIACEENYTMFGEDTVTCLADGNLSSIPKCVQCPEFEIENGTVNISQPVAEVMCDTGFVLEGNDTIKCQDNGNWTTLPHCEIVDCGPPDNVDNGIIELNAANETVFKSKAYIKCDYGFEISGDGILNCEANASWIGYKRCNIITCPTYNVTANMAIMNDTGLDMYDLNTTLRLNCTDGYSFTTNETFVVCVASGGWEGNPACHIDQCTVFDIDNGNYSSMLSVVDFNETIIFSCNDGYDIFGENILVCGAKGRWSDYPKCVPINCTAFERPNNSTVTPEKDIYIFNDSVVVNCSEGFELVGNASTQCLPNGSWTSYPTCERVGCGKYSVANGKVNSTEDINGTTMHVVCDVGYSLVGNSTVVCKEDGSWTSGVSCLIIDCGNYTANASARYNVDPGETQFDSRLQVTCIPGTVFTESSDKEVICKENGWHGNPECEIPVNFVSNTYELSVSEPGIITCIGSLSNWTQIHIESEDDSTSVILFANGTNNLGNTTNIDVSRSVINETAAMLVVDFTPVACPATGEESLNYTCAIQTDSVNYSAITSIRFHKARGNLTFVLPKSAQEGELTGQRDPLQCSLELGYPAEQFVLKIETYNSSTRNYETFNRGKNQSTVAGEDCPPNIKLEYINMNFSSTENGTRLRCSAYENASFLEPKFYTEDLQLNIISNPCNGTGTYTIKHPTACEYFIKCQNGIMSALRCEAEGTCPIILDLDFTACTSEQCNEC